MFPFKCFLVWDTWNTDEGMQSDNRDLDPSYYLNVFEPWNRNMRCEILEQCLEIVNDIYLLRER